MKKLVGGFLVLLLLSCTPAAGPPPPAKVEQTDLAAQLAALPGTVLQSEDELQFSYPEQALFARGAVLPLPGGSKVLDPLAGFLLRHPGLTWQVDVRVQTEFGEAYDQTLAEKRSELLATYLLNKKVALNDLIFNPLAAAGEPVTFTLKQSQKAAQQ